MAAPAMVNASAFPNLTLTRVQLLKSQLPVAELPDDTRIMDVRANKVSEEIIFLNYVLSVCLSILNLRFVIAVGDRNYTRSSYSQQ